MMTLKYPEPVVRSQDQVIREPALFTLPPQGVATLSATDALGLDTFCTAIRARLSGPVRLTAHPHRIGSRTSVALHLEGPWGVASMFLSPWPVTRCGLSRTNTAIHAGMSQCRMRPMWCICCST